MMLWHPVASLFGDGLQGRPVHEAARSKPALQGHASDASL